MALSNTSVRIIVSIIAIPVVVGLCILGGYPFWLFMMALALMGYYEFVGMTKQKQVYTNKPAGFFAVLVIMTSVFFWSVDTLDIVVGLFVIIIFWELFRNKGSAINNIGATLLGVLYTGLLPGTVVLIRELYRYNDMLYPTGGYLILSILVSIWACDSAAYFIGSAIGKHKLFPRVSPKKSWEGAIAGFAFSIIAMLAMKYFLLDYISMTDAVVIGLIVGIFGQTGDLIESLIKRDAGVKDSSKLIPGHGGVLDRFDSLLLTAPLVYMYLKHFSI